MIAVDLFRNETVLILGLGKTGWSAARSLIAGGAQVIAWDDQPERRVEQSVEGLIQADPQSLDWQKIRAVILSPGIPHRFPSPHPVIAQANRYQIPIYSDIELYLKSCPCAVTVGVTGTNGKSTTTALIAHILQSSGKAAQMGGNIGQPVLSLDNAEVDSTTIIELSSYQLELMPFQAHEVAILLNISPDHLTHHGGMEGYIKAKQKIFETQRPGQKAVVGIDDQGSVRVYHALKDRSLATWVPISAQQMVKGGVSVLNNVLYDATAGEETHFDLSNGGSDFVYNGQNVAAAYVTCRHFGLSREQFIVGLSTFKNLAHRQELVAVIDNITYINDSKATNPEATEQALRAYNDIFWILGGRPKEVSVERLMRYHKRVRHAFLIGEAQAQYGPVLRDYMPLTLLPTLEEALQAARALALASALPNPVVLLSPACASFDMYRNFEARGEHFKQLVRKLPGVLREPEIGRA